MDEAVQEYFRSVEEHFIRRRGHPLMLSPSDVRRVVEWHQAGIPLPTIVEGIDIYFDRMARRERPARRAVTLKYVEDDVHDAWAGARHRRMGRAQSGAGAAAEPLASAGEHQRLLDALHAAAERLDAGTPEDRLVAVAARSAHEKLGKKRELFDVTAEDHDEQRTEDHLRRIERALAAAAREALGAGAEALEGEVIAELAGKRARMSDSTHQRVLGQLVDQRLRQRFGLPRLSLFYS